MSEHPTSKQALETALHEWSRWARERVGADAAVPFNEVLTLRAQAISNIIQAAHRVVADETDAPRPYRCLCGHAIGNHKNLTQGCALCNCDSFVEKH